MTYCCFARPLDFTEIFSLDYNMEFLPKGYLKGQFITITKTDYLLFLHILLGTLKCTLRFKMFSTMNYVRRIRPIVVTTGEHVLITQNTRWFQLWFLGRAGRVKSI